MQVTTYSPEELMASWIEGWPEYSIFPNDDYSSICQLKIKIANCLKIDPEDPTKQSRLHIGITNIASYCRYSEKWGTRNIYYANMCFQTLYNEMKTRQRLQSIKDQNYHYKK